MDEALEAAKERAWREVAAIDAAHARGELDDEGWYAATAALVVPAYLGARTCGAAPGTRGPRRTGSTRAGIVADAVERSGTFLDVGCANGLLMESVARWGRDRGLAVEPYGVDISPELAALARSRLPQWADRIYVANALGWRPPFRFDVVRTALEYVPPPRARELAEWLLDEVVAPGGRLVVGKFNEEVERRAHEEQVAAWGFRIAGRAERPHRASLGSRTASSGSTR